MARALCAGVFAITDARRQSGPIVQRFFQFCRYSMSLDVIQKVRYRYQQTERGAAVVANSGQARGCPHRPGGLVQRDAGSSY
jgi:hypothetical protein